MSVQIFKIERDGEFQRFRPFKDLPNRQLLWHGSRTTNYAGILSQGLRIAPPEAPVVRIKSFHRHLVTAAGMLMKSRVEVQCVITRDTNVSATEKHLNQTL